MVLYEADRCCLGCLAGELDLWNAALSLYRKADAHPRFPEPSGGLRSYFNACNQHGHLIPVIWNLSDESVRRGGSRARQGCST